MMMIIEVNINLQFNYAAIPRYTADVRFINQYVYSVSAVADIECPFEISSGRLGEPVEISWSTADLGGTRVGSLPNATSGAYWLEKEGNRILHVNISTLGRLGYQCAGSVEICGEPHTSCRLSPPSWSPSPTFVVMPTLGKLCMNLYNNYTCVQIFSRYSTMRSCLAIKL